MVKNKHYRMFLDHGIIETINETQLTNALNNINGIRGSYTKEARSLLITLYYTGARPNEILNLKAKAFTTEKSYLKILVPGSKKGLPRTLYLRISKPLVKELHEYATSCMPEMYLFYHYRSNYTRQHPTKKGITERTEVTNRLRYYFDLWFKDIFQDSINPYYLRHNRMSKLAEAGASMQELRMLKGSRTYESVIPYLHMSSKTGKQLAKKIN